MNLFLCEECRQPDVDSWPILGWGGVTRQITGGSGFKVLCGGVKRQITGASGFKVLWGFIWICSPRSLISYLYFETTLLIILGTAVDFCCLSLNKGQLVTSLNVAIRFSTWRSNSFWRSCLLFRSLCRVDLENFTLFAFFVGIEL